MKSAMHILHSEFTPRRPGRHAVSKLVMTLDYLGRTYRLTMQRNLSSTDCLGVDGNWHRVRTIMKGNQ